MIDYKFKNENSSYRIIVTCENEQTAIEIFEGIVPKDKQQLYKLDRD